MARQTKPTPTEIAQAQADLRAMLKPGDTVHCIMRHVSSSGMSRVIDLVIPVTGERREPVFPETAIRGWKGLEAYQRNGPNYRTAPVIGYRADEDTLLLKYPTHGGEEGFAQWVKRSDLSVTRTTPRASIQSISWLVAKACEHNYDNRKSGIKIAGAGMDMGFSLVYDLGRTLWPKGTAKPHGTRNGEPDREGGYALKHNWL